MWLPSRVETKHKTRACLVWSSLVAALVSYTLWVVISAVQKRENPSISLTVEDDIYPFPDVSICFSEGYGCDNGSYTSFCAESAIEFGYRNNATPSVGFVEVSDGSEDILGTINPDFYNCLDFPISQFTMNQSALEELAVPLAELRLQWNAAYYRSHKPEVISETIFVYMYNPDEGLLQNTPATAVPYNRINSSDVLTRVLYTTMNIDLRETKKLSGKSEKQYGPTSMSHSYFDIAAEYGWTTLYEDTYDGLLFVFFEQPSLSHTVLEEINPVQIATIIGSIGGAWELLLIIWGVLFIANQQQDADLKARNLVKSVIRGTEAIVRNATTVTKSVSTRRGSSTSGVEDEERPAWDTSGVTGFRAPPPPPPAPPLHDGQLPRNGLPASTPHQSGHEQPQGTFAGAYGGEPHGSFHTNHTSQSGGGLEPSTRRPVVTRIPSVARRPSV